MIDIDQYARDTHALITIGKKVPPDCQSNLELICTRVVELLDRVAELEREREEARIAALPGPYVGGLDD